MKIGDRFVSENWLGNTEEYKIVRNHIHNIFLETLQKLNKDKENWSIPYFNDYFFEGEADMNGNPIFSAKNELEQYIIKVVIDILYDSTSTWVSDFYGAPLHTIYLNPDYISSIEPFFNQVLKKQAI